MATDKTSIIIQAESEGKQTPVTGWYFIGFFLGLIGILIVYLRSPKVPVSLLVESDEEDRYFYEKAYVEALKARQIRATWIGFAIGFAVGIALYVLAMILLITFSGTL